MKKQFTTTLEGVTSNKTKTTIKLSMSNKDAMVFNQRYLQSLDKELIVSFDDPQTQMDLDDEDERPERRKITTDQFGVVESVGRQLDFGDAKPANDQVPATNPAEQAEAEPGAHEAAGHADEYAGKEIVITRSNLGDDGEGNSDTVEYVFPIVSGTGRTPKKYINGEDAGVILGDNVKNELDLEHSEGCYAIEDLLKAGGILVGVQDGASAAEQDELEWDGQSDKGSDGGDDELSDWEREVLGEGQTDDADSLEAAGADKQERDAVADTVNVETYILTVRPSFDDIPYEFPALLERRNAGETWKAISESIGVGNKELGNAWRRYKDRAAAQQSAGK
ncbi:hypothetical protein PV433_10535 [Paenibacillus sp. GYB004]|uniref:hypothetical protein n=1 Tax=Paenibacillus sp. GYB004 TaxID=2994393 RepID=UPI002F96D865